MVGVRVNNRQSKLKSEDVMNIWSLAEQGKSYKKKNKKLMRRKQRTLLKRNLHNDEEEK